MVDRTDFQTLDALNVGLSGCHWTMLYWHPCEEHAVAQRNTFIVVRNRSDDDDSTEKSYGGT